MMVLLPGEIALDTEEVVVIYKVVVIAYLVSVAGAELIHTLSRGYMWAMK